MKQNEYGFTLPEILLIMALVFVIGFTGWYVIETRNNISTDNATPQSTTNEVGKNKISEYKRTTSVPIDWKTYENKQYGITFSYPGISEVKEDAKSNPALYDYEIGVSASQQTFDALIGINKLPLETAVNRYKSNFLQAGSEQLRPKIIIEKNITIDGYHATEIQYSQITGMAGSPETQKESPPETQYFIFANGYTYTLPIVTTSDINPQFTAKESLIFFESVHFNKPS